MIVLPGSVHDLSGLPQALQEIFSQQEYSPSEARGLNLLTDSDLMVFSPGISTAGVAEISMALANSRRQIVTTTIDEVGMREVQKYVRMAGLQRQIFIRNEDVSKPMPYPNDYFDFIYARLLLHYLPKALLESTLKEMYRILRSKSGWLFAVVRSADDPDIKIPGTSYDPVTCLTSYFPLDQQGNIDRNTIVKRYFHTKAGFANHLKDAGFKVDQIDQHDEQLYADFSRKKLAFNMANVIEVVARKNE